MTAPAALLHLGFHKTGTSTAQHFLADNRARLAPYLRVVLLDELKPADKTARRFSKARDAASLVEFAAAFAGCLEAAGRDRDRPLLLSCEGLSGDIPGRAGVSDYAAAVELAPVIARVARHLGYPGATLRFSLRDPQDWLFSAYLHNIRGTRLDMDFAEYAAAFRRSADLRGIVDRVRAACPDNPVTTSRLGDTTEARFGPATPLLAPFELPEELLSRLIPPHFVNPALPAALITPFRRLNRGPLTGKALKAAKARLLAGSAAEQPDTAAR